uniref:Uncharacterized protein n=1 Tax=Anguilla anguilla TaxID=7936 RepID=A0A0E9RW26_ANGAN
MDGLCSVILKQFNKGTSKEQVFTSSPGGAMSQANEELQLTVWNNFGPLL